MTFQELLEKYKNGTATKDEILLVESELEKNEAINNYLDEELSLLDLNSNPYIPDQSTTTKKIKHTVNKKLSKIIVISVASVFIILLSIKFIISPLIASQYYNPSTKTMDEYSQDFFWDLKIINELTNPGFGINYAHAVDKNFGNYDNYYLQTNLFTGETYNNTFQINRGIKNTNNFVDFNSTLFKTLWKTPRKDDIFTKELSFEYEFTKKKLEHLKSLPPTNYVSAFIYLKEDIDMKELTNLVYKYDNINFNWGAVRVSNDPIELPLGFRINVNGDGHSGDTSYYSKYPALQLGDIYLKENPNGGETILPQGFKNHFKSLLNYLNDHPKAAKTLSNYDLNYSNFISYIEENDVNCYGILVYANVEDLLSFYENEGGLTIDIDNVLPSAYSSKYKN